MGIKDVSQLIDEYPLIQIYIEEGHVSLAFSYGLKYQGTRHTAAVVIINARRASGFGVPVIACVPSTSRTSAVSASANHFSTWSTRRPDTES